MSPGSSPAAGAMEDRERELQRVEKPRLRARTQFRARPEVPGDDAGGPQSARLRLAYRARTAGAPMAGGPSRRRQTNQLLRPRPDADRLRDLSLLEGLPTIPRDLHYPARTRKKSGKPVNDRQMPTFRIAGRNT